MYYLRLLLRCTVACGGAGMAGALLVLNGVPFAIPVAVGGLLLVAVLFAYNAFEGVRGRHRTFVYEALFVGLIVGPIIVVLH